MRSEKLSARRGTLWLVASLALIPALVKLLCYPRNIGSDDAYIHLQIATNFVHGLGWGINPHQPVNLIHEPGFYPAPGRYGEHYAACHRGYADSVYGCGRRRSASYILRGGL